MYLVFYRTVDVFEAEELLQSSDISTEIVPTPVQDKAYCGVCVKINYIDLQNSKICLNNMDFIIVE